MDQIDSSDLTIPQIKVAQSLSPELDADNKNYIEGLRDGDVFLTGVKQVLGKVPVEFVVGSWSKYGVEKDPQTKKYLGRTPADDPRTKFGRNGEKPTVDLTYEFYVYTPSLPSLYAVLRLDKTKIGAAKDLVQQFKQLGGVSKGLFRLTPIREANAAGQKFSNFRVSLVNKATPEQYYAAKQLFALVEQGKTKVDADETIDAQVVDSDIPF
jgi:hypothetical protein